MKGWGRTFQSSPVKIFPVNIFGKSTPTMICDRSPFGQMYPRHIFNPPAPIFAAGANQGGHGGEHGSRRRVRRGRCGRWRWRGRGRGGRHGARASVVSGDGLGKAASRRKADRRSGERRERRRAPGDLGEQRGGDATARSAGHERHERVDLGAERSEDADGDHGKSHAVR